MTLFKTKKSIPEGSCRIIKLDKDALFELICETFIDNQKLYFDVSDGTKIVTQFALNWDSGEFICIAQNIPSSKKDSHRIIDADQLLSKVKATTNSMYTDHRYIEISEEEIKSI